MTVWLALIAATGLGTGCAGLPPASTGSCALPEPVTARRDGNAVLLTWEFPVTPVWSSEALPDAGGYHTYRRAMQEAQADMPRPPADPLPPAGDPMRQVWVNEAFNVDMVFAGGGEVRPVRCLEAALFAVQDARYSQLTQPTELIAHVLRRADRLRILLGASDAMFPPRQVYGLDEVESAVRDGWEYWAVLHNHTVRRLDGRLALGMPVPSTSDVQLFRRLVAELGMREVWVTNGLYIGVVPSENLARLRARD